jgi:formiminotetrahydrofolate cyclodeaminase
MEEHMPDKSQAALLVNIPVTSFIQNVASRTAAPGGGSVAAMAGSLGAGLGIMMTRLTIGRKKYKEHEDEMRSMQKDLLPLRDKLKDLIDKDTFAFDQVMAAIKMPKDTQEQKKTREEAMLKANKNAALVPLEVMKHSVKTIEYLVEIAKKGNVNSISDAGVANLCLHTAFEGAKLNVLINTKNMEATDWKKQLIKEVEELSQNFSDRYSEISSTVNSKLA